MKIEKSDILMQKNYKESDKLMNKIYQQIKLDNKGIEMILSSQHESGA